MATLGPEPRPLSQLPSAALQTNLSGLGSSTNLPLNRGLERALEDAANSGFLNLSTRKLKEFPRTASNYDLTDTVEADLSKNRLIDVPSEVCHLVSLETLNLYHNCIKSIPDTIISLQSLTCLNISRNQLSVLPACVCGLPLRVLNASNNKLNALPESIGQLTNLMELDVSCNEITALPRQIVQLKSLRELNVHRNLLCVLPEDLADLPLVKFDFCCNKVSTIPVCYRKMTQLQSLQLENNPLQSPPAQICMKGKIHIFKYLAMEACRSDKMADALYLPVTDRLSLTRPSNGSTEDIDQHKKLDSDSGVGSDNGDKRLSATEPSDEDSLSLNVPMTNITEEEGLSKDDSSEHISGLTGDRSSSESLKDHLSYRDSALSSPFVNYIKGRGADFDEPLRIEEDTNWVSEQTAKVNMINQLKEAVEMLQDPNRVNMNSADLSGIKLYPVEMVAVDDSLNGQESDEGQATPKGDVIGQEGAGDSCENQITMNEEKTPVSSPTLNSPPFGLKPRSASPSVPCSTPPCPLPLTQAPPTDRDTPPSPAEGDMPSSVFFRTHKTLESVDPQFTMRRKMEQLREELELTEQLRESIESRLKVVLPEDLGCSLSDGVVLCHLVNHIRPRSVGSIHVPSPAVPKLSMAKCRRNVENFLDACRKMGVPESSLCSAYDVLQCNLRPLWAVVAALLMVESTGTRHMEGKVEGGREKETEVKKLIPESTQTPPPSWQIWDLIGSSLLHVFCLVMLFVAYSWSEFK
ncbi:leucine-rich repeat and calponin homology domain-containing protein 1 isoform X2 [Danio rerio]|uniref:Leucine-rich repeat and calponin homology domain-containing protein 1 isoform X2 n=1 Tax=Danio rerio TaxID=7955 RepID=A0A8M9PSW1_DANRE|nr:leucine-rich repeat and calponin homology domain-containing protein 1 isoform X2 [Danio rerio]|eukprot:XP_021334627.1 leucine-rich repeat and calponin homology domain-containing protein 1 isoform X2 [Danio rerio]